MIAIARKNLSCLYLSPNSFLCNFNVHFIPSIHFFSSSSITKLTPSSEIYDVMVHRHNFPPELAALAASRNPKIADSVLSFLKENSFTNTQLQKIVIYDPRILGFTIDSLKSRFKAFQELGLSSEEIAKIMFYNPSILHSSDANRIVPKLSLLKGLLGSNDDVARLLKICSWFVTSTLEKTLMPNVEILKSCAIPMERILHFLYIQPRCFLVKSDVMTKSVDRAIEIGVPQTSYAFIQVVSVFSYVSEGMWEVKLQTLRDLGFSDNDVFAMIRSQPLVFALSVEKMKNVTELLLATGKYSISSIVSNPSSLGYSIEKRLEPRLQILGVLDSRNLIQQWPSLAALTQWNNDKFFDRCIRPYYDGIGEEHITRYMSRTKKR